MGEGQKVAEVGRVLALRVQNMSSNAWDCHTLKTIIENGLALVANYPEGRVLRIQLWTPRTPTQAKADGLVEMSDERAAQGVLNKLDEVEQQAGGVYGRLKFAPSEKHQKVRIGDPQHGIDFETGQGQGARPEPCPPQHALTGAMPQGNAFHMVPGAGYSVGPQGHFAGAGGMAHGSAQPPTVVLVTNLYDGTTPEAIFRLFGTCGDVIAVKIVYKNNSQALVQFREPEHAATAIEQLNRCPFYEDRRNLHVSASKHTLINGPPDDLTCYWNPDHPHHRFNGKTAERNLERRYGPQQQILISNIPQQLPEEHLKKMLENFGTDFTMKWLEQKQGQKSKMCQVLYKTVREAVSALIGLHGVEFNEMLAPGGRGVVVSFSNPNTSRGATLQSRVRGQGEMIMPPGGAPVRETETADLARAVEEEGH